MDCLEYSQNYDKIGCLIILLLLPFFSPYYVCVKGWLLLRNYFYSPPCFIIWVMYPSEIMIINTQYHNIWYTHFDSLCAVFILYSWKADLVETKK